MHSPVSRSRRWRVRKRRVRLTFVLLCASIVLLAVVLRVEGRPAPLQAQTPLVAVTAPPPVWSAQQRAALKSALSAALQPAIEGARAWSFAAIAADGTPLYEDRAGSAVVPASVEKLIVSDAALTDLGTSFHFDTLFASNSAPSGGALDGDLWFVGSGDPSLRWRDLDAGVRALKAAGIEAIRGRIVVDPHALSGEEINPLWDAADANEDFMAPTSGVSLDEDTVEFDVTGTLPGEAARVVTLPETPAVQYSGIVRTGGGNFVIVAATEEPNQFRLSGNIPPGITERYWVPVHDIPRYAGRVVATFLQRDGIDAGDAPATGFVPMDATILWEHHSQPLPQLLRHMLIYSDNHYAEQLMRTVGEFGGSAPDDRGGILEEERVLRDQRIPAPGLHLVDGSGLSPDNRIAAITLAGILAHFQRQPEGNPLYPLLARGGIDGTLKRYGFTAAAGRVRAKTGHLAGAASLAGYVDTRHHGRVSFAFTIDGSPADPDAAMTAAVDRIAQW
jgi:D-alanyl-D-alanine carboxypeptidase/D-alanyl-D-alanine-endopeptidase (penicillin-binding protein 4)